MPCIVTMPALRLTAFSHRLVMRQCEASRPIIRAFTFSHAGVCGYVADTNRFAAEK